MSAIFKNRKTPRHLIIETEEGPMRRKRRVLPLLLLGCVALLVFVVLQQGF